MNEVLEVEGKTSGIRASKAVLLGWVLSALPALLLIGSSVGKFTQQPKVVEGLTAHYGYPASAISLIACLECGFAVLSLIPATSVLGTVLLTGFLGGMAATHLRAQEPFVAPLVLGILIWVGLVLREPRLRRLLPLRK